MAKVFEHKYGIYKRNNAFEVEGMSVDEAIDSIIDEPTIDGKVSYNHDVIGYGPNAVLICIDGVPYIIIGD